jgi:hypothetical protein
MGWTTGAAVATERKQPLGALTAIFPAAPPLCICISSLFRRTRSHGKHQNIAIHTHRQKQIEIGIEIEIQPYDRASTASNAPLRHHAFTTKRNWPI